MVRGYPVFKGSVTAIHLIAASGEEPVSKQAVRAIPGQGLEGDRNCKTHETKPYDALTLIEREAIEALARDYGVELAPGQSRRNVETVGVPLNHLVGREFRIGMVRLRGAELCEPCNYLAGKTHPRTLPGLIHRGGIRAEILSAGEICVGDPIELVD